MFHKILTLYFGGFIVFWFLGIDQLYFIFICTVGVFSLLSTHKIIASKETIFFGIFVLASFISVFQISSTARYITYFRNEGVYLAMLFVFISSSYASANKVNVIDKLYFALLLFSIQCSIVAILASTGTSISFKSIAGYLIPDLGSQYIKGMLNKNSIQAEALWFSKGFYRPRGLMLYPNTMAGILASTLAIKGYFVYKFCRDRYIVFALACSLFMVMDLYSIYASLSRSTWISLVFALAIFPFVFKTSLVTKLFPMLIGIVILFMVVITGLSDGIESRLVDKTHSNEGRGLNYRLIWEETTSSVDKILFGHGTQIDHWLLSIPLGSHSTYLGIFFKYGMVGSIFIVLFLFFLYIRSLTLTRTSHNLNKHSIRYIRPFFLCFALIIPVVQMVFIEIDVDFSYALYFSTLVFLVGQESQLVNKMLGVAEIKSKRNDILFNTAIDGKI